MRKILSLFITFCIFFTACSGATEQSAETTSQVITNYGEITTQILTTEATSTLQNITTAEEDVPISDSDRIIKELFDSEKSDVQIKGSGKVSQLLEDDNDDTPHQRFILMLESGQTLLVAHNIAIAPRLENLEIGDTVEFYGEYYYTAEGGGIHWTHADPDGSHVDGYLKANGNIYQEITTVKVETTKKIVTTEEVVTTEKVETAEQIEQNYIGNKNSKVLHSESCDSLPASRNRVYFSNIDDALSQGYHKHYECMGN